MLSPPTNIIAAARTWLGTPYAHQASLKAVGCDCLGLVRGVWRDLHGEEPEAVPAYSPDWAEAGGGETLAEAARRNMEEIAPQTFEGGDLLLFRWRPHLPAKHAAIATSRNTMIHAQEGACVCEVAIGNWWRRRIAYAFRFPPPHNSSTKPWLGGGGPRGTRGGGGAACANLQPLIR